MKMNYCSIAVVGLIAAFTVVGGKVALAQGCCSSGDSHDCPMGQEGRMAAVANTSVTPKEPTAAVTAVLEQYGKIQMALANNKLDGVADSARAIKKIIADDVKRTLPAEISEPTENLTSAKDLGAARTAFELLSASLGEFLAKQKIQTGRYFQIYCPMAEASWLQTDKTVRNPYYGKSMPGCGKVVATY